MKIYGDNYSRIIIVLIRSSEDVIQQISNFVCPKHLENHNDEYFLRDCVILVISNAKIHMIIPTFNYKFLLEK